jgi:hypothetical protein
MGLQSQFGCREKRRVSSKALKCLTRPVSAMSVNRHLPRLNGHNSQETDASTKLPIPSSVPGSPLFIARAERQARPLPTITFARLIRPLEGHLSAPATGSRQPCPLARTRFRNRTPLRQKPRLRTEAETCCDHHDRRTTQCRDSIKVGTQHAGELGQQNIARYAGAYARQHAKHANAS